MNSPSFNSPPQQSTFPPFDSHVPYQPPNQPQSETPSPPYYAPPQNPIPNPNPNPNPMYSVAPYGQVAVGESWSEHHGCSLPGMTSICPQKCD